MLTLWRADEEDGKDVVERVIVVTDCSNRCLLFLLQLLFSGKIRFLSTVVCMYADSFFITRYCSHTTSLSLL